MTRAGWVADRMPNAKARWASRGVARAEARRVARWSLPRGAATRGAVSRMLLWVAVFVGFAGLGVVVLGGLVDRAKPAAASAATDVGGHEASSRTAAARALDAPSGAFVWPASGTRLTAPDALAATRSGEAVLVDIRRPEEWAETGVAETAIPISIESHPDGVQGFLRDLEWATGGDRSKPLILICRTGNRTAQLAPQLRQLGYARVYTVDEGMAGSRAGPGWLARDLPLR